jgi:hypothetical protein
MHFIFNLLFLAAGIKWGDWKNWKLYYATILFFIGGDLLKNALLHNHLMWEYKETIFGEEILFSHLIINLMIMVLVYPSTILIYLGHFPKTVGKRFLWLSFWVFMYSGIEFINLKYLNLIEHHYGWTMSWSILFNTFMFFILAVHFKWPLLAISLSFLWLLFLWNVHDIPIRFIK